MVDSYGHTYGPDNHARISEAVQRVDAALGYLLEQVFKKQWRK
jgi:predicted AlkP superfamily pyrophosphatase or phosphodiesterase